MLNFKVKVKKKTGVFVKHECPPRQQSPTLAISIKIAVKVTRSLNRYHYLSMHAKYEISISYGSKIMAKD